MAKALGAQGAGGLHCGRTRGVFVPSTLVRRSIRARESEAKRRSSAEEDGASGRDSIASSSDAFIEDFITSGKLSGDEAPSAAAERAARRHELRESDLGEDNHRRDYESVRREPMPSRAEEEPRPVAIVAKQRWAALRFGRRMSLPAPTGQTLPAPEEDSVVWPDLVHPGSQEDTQGSQADTAVLPAKGKGHATSASEVRV